MSREKKGLTKAAAADLTKGAILDAAETLFAEKGFAATSLQEICDLAGVTRGLPNYFFGSKEDLYRAVLERTFARPQKLVNFIHEQMQRPGANPKEILTIVIEGLFDDFVNYPTFIRITGWEALQGGRYLGNLPVQLKVFREALQVLREDLGWQGDPEQFLIDLVALCWFHIAHADTFIKPLGLSATDPDFLSRRKQHIIQLLLG